MWPLRPGASSTYGSRTAMYAFTSTMLKALYCAMRASSWHCFSSFATVALQNFFVFIFSHRDLHTIQRWARVRNFTNRNSVRETKVSKASIRDCPVIFCFYFPCCFITSEFSILSLKQHNILRREPISTTLVDTMYQVSTHIQCSDFETHLPSPRTQVQHADIGKNWSPISSRWAQGGDRATEVRKVLLHTPKKTRGFPHQTWTESHSQR